MDLRLVASGSGSKAAVRAQRPCNHAVVVLLISDDLLTRCHLPHRTLIAIANAADQQPFPIRTEAQWTNLRALVGEGAQKLPGGTVPQADLTVDATRGDGSIRHGDRQPVDPGLVPGQRRNLVCRLLLE